MSKIIGIDLGTTNSCVAIIEGDTPTVLVNEEGSRTTPSVVGFVEGDTPLVGEIARRQSAIKPKETIYSAKRFIGSKFSEVKDIAKTMPFDVVKSSNGEVHISVNDKMYSPPEISAKVLLKLKRSAEKYLGETVSEAVITVPAYFNDSQRQATKDAGKIAGLEVKRIINEPTAAALAYGLDKTEDELIAVYDFGGGTFDISILEVSSEMVEVLSTSGDTRLGGDNIDEKVIKFLTKEFKSATGVDVSNDSMAMQRLKEAAENAKKELSSTVQAQINLPFLTATDTGPQHLNVTLTRSKFETLIDPIVKKTFKACKQALSDSKKSVKDINQVVLVGGSTRIPKVVEDVSKFFDQKPNQGVNPDEVVALGAAVQGGVLSGEVSSMLLLDVTPLSLGIETMGNVCTVLIPRNTTIPTKKSEIFSTAENNQSGVNVHVLQGERQMSADNRTLGNFMLDGIPPAPRGVPQIEVAFDIDANGILNVSATDKATGKEQQITITSSSGLSDTDIDKMVREAKDNEESDKSKRELVETHNKLDSLLYQSRKTLDELGDNLSDGDKSAAMAAIEAAASALETNEKQTMMDATQTLEAALHSLAQSLYNTTDTEQPVSPQAGPSPEDDGVIDAEFEEE